MGQYPVTFQEYDRFAGATDAKRQGWGRTFMAVCAAIRAATDVERPADRGWGRGRRPVINVSWEDAKAYAAWLSEQTGKRYRLPSESEWEYAARAGTETAYSWGNEIGVNRANGCDSGSKWSGEQTAPVGSFAANAFGLFDMHGNVNEWAEDCWHDSYKGAPTDGSAWTTNCSNRFLLRVAVVRGGAWFNNPRYLRAAVRDWSRPSYRSFNLGFRLVRDLNP